MLPAALLVAAALFAGATPDSAPIQSVDARKLRVPEFARGEDVVRCRAVRIRKDAFSKKIPFDMRLTLFPDAVLTIRWDYTRALPSGGSEYTGRVNGSIAGTAALILAGSTVTASINDGQKWLYEIRTDSEGILWIVQKSARKRYLE